MGRLMEYGKQGQPQTLYQLRIRSKVPLSKVDKERVENWFGARSKTDSVQVGFEVVNSKNGPANGK